MIRTSRLAGAALMLAVLSNSALAQSRADQLRQIYPHVPVPTADINAAVVRM